MNPATPRPNTNSAPPGRSRPEWDAQPFVRYVGIDEAGYGPNLGPLTMAAAIFDFAADYAHAQGWNGRSTPPPFNLWSASAGRVTRAGGPEHALWIDDSKSLYSTRRGRDRLDAALLTLLTDSAAWSQPSLVLEDQLAAVGLTDLVLNELDLWNWHVPETSSTTPASPSALSSARSPLTNPFWEAQRNGVSPLDHPGRWQVRPPRAALLGPRRFEAWLHAPLESPREHSASFSSSHRLKRDTLPPQTKADVHLRLFMNLLTQVWNDSPADLTIAQCDLHGGRRYYLKPLTDAFGAFCRVEVIEESPDARSYRLTATDALGLASKSPRRLVISFRAKADRDDAAVALASVVAKSLREGWMDRFNAFWIAHLPTLRPTAGYPLDARRFRDQIAPLAERLGLEPAVWWRSR